MYIYIYVDVSVYTLWTFSNCLKLSLMGLGCHVEFPVP